MAWNRKRRVRVARGIWVGRIVAASVAVACLSLWYVWLKVRMVDMGYQIRDREKRLSAFKKENQVLRMKISQMKSPKNIEAVIRTKEMNLAATKRSQVVMLAQTAEASSIRISLPQTPSPSTGSGGPPSAGSERTQIASMLATIKQAEPPGRIPIH